MAASPDPLREQLCKRSAFRRDFLDKLLCGPPSHTRALRSPGFYAYYAAAVADVEGHVVWSEPYTYVGTGFLGTTVTSPAFDRTDPSNPVFIGVAGIDLLIPAMETIHGGDADDARAGVMRALGERAATNCPDQLPTSSPDFECEIQSLRRASGAGSPGR